MVVLVKCRKMAPDRKGKGKGEMFRNLTNGGSSGGGGRPIKRAPKGGGQ